MIARIQTDSERTRDLERLVVGLKARLGRVEQTRDNAISMVDVWYTRAVDAEWHLRQLRRLGEVGE